GATDDTGDTTGDTGADEGFANTTDKTNGNAQYVGSNACRECHAQIAEWQNISGHSWKLNRIEGVAPEYPEEGIYAGVPNPPDGFEWTDIAYVIGGYNKKARFIDKDGFILTTGVLGIDTQWNLKMPANGTEPGFVAYEADRETPKPYDYSCFQCHTTGAQPQDEDEPLFQENRPGFAGTWVETGIQCEACHGPGSEHFATAGDQVTINRDRIFVDETSSETCRQCHNRPFNDDTGKILASGGYIKHHEQWPELRASGGHSSFACTTCHDPHRSVLYDRENAIVVECEDCHPDIEMPLHEGEVFTRGDYTEEVTCVSCHMPFATKSATKASADVVGEEGRMGDTRTHIFRIDTREVDYNSMFTDDGSEVVRDDQGRAAVTLDFVCLRCHNDIGTFKLQLRFAADIANGFHDN
ncbi:MAG: hypothetical protein D6744_06740, partial [Planctomycetota bacterium]